MAHHWMPIPVSKASRELTVKWKMAGEKGMEGNKGIREFFVCLFSTNGAQYVLYILSLYMHN